MAEIEPTRTVCRHRKYLKCLAGAGFGIVYEENNINGRTMHAAYLYSSSQNPRKIKLLKRLVCKNDAHWIWERYRSG